MTILGRRIGSAAGRDIVVIVFVSVALAAGIGSRPIDFTALRVEPSAAAALRRVLFPVRHHQLLGSPNAACARAVPSK